MSYLGISKRLANFITKDLNYDEEKKEVITYAIETLFLSLIGTVAILIVAYIFDALFPAAIAAIFGGLLRRVSGGAHFNTPVKCLSFGAFIYSFIGVLAKNVVSYGFYNYYILITLLFGCLLVVGILAPVDSEAKPIHSKDLKIKLKIAAIIFVAIAMFIFIFNDNTILKSSIVLGITYQTITLLPIFNR